MEANARKGREWRKGRKRKADNKEESGQENPATMEKGGGREIGAEGWH